MFFSHPFVFFGEMSVYFCSPFFDWVFYFSRIELQELLVYPPPETGRRGQPELEGGNRGPREASYTKLQADFVAN